MYWRGYRDPETHRWEASGIRGPQQGAEQREFAQNGLINKNILLFAALLFRKSIHPPINLTAKHSLSTDLYRNSDDLNSL